MRRSADYLGRLLVGRRFRKVEVNPKGGGRYADKMPDGMVELNAQLLGTAGLRINAIECKGKFMYWNLGDWWLWCTYGMSGQWTTQEPDKHTALTVWVDEPLQQLHFRDPRHFGTVKFVYDPDDVLTKKKLSSLGPDMLKNPPDEQTFRAAIRTKANNKTLAEALMDQSVISGVGNYVKAEALYLAELSPHRTVSSLSGTDLEHLRQQIINVMGASYNSGGATISTYRNVDGSKGGAQRRFAVYGNSTDPMGNPVVKEETKDGRTTHWVPAIQH